jgi:hypothetical protein
MSAFSVVGSYKRIKSRRRDVPKDYCAFRFPLATGFGITLAERLEYGNEIPKVAVLFAVHTEDTTYRAAKPIQVHVYRDDDIFVAENEVLLVTGTGESAWEAVEDLELNIVHFWKYYSGLDECQVMGDAKRLKSLYAGLLEKEE